MSRDARGEALACQQLRAKEATASQMLSQERVRLEAVASNALKKLQALNHSGSGGACKCREVESDGAWATVRDLLNASLVASAVSESNSGGRHFACRSCGTHYNVARDFSSWHAVKLADAIRAASPTWLRLLSNHKDCESQLADQEARFASAVLAEATAAAHEGSEWRERLLQAEEVPSACGSEAVHLAQLAMYVAMAAGS